MEQEQKTGRGGGGGGGGCLQIRYFMCKHVDCYVTFHTKKPQSHPFWISKVNMNEGCTHMINHNLNFMCTHIVFVSHKYNILINQYNFSQSSTSTVSNYPPPPPPPNFSSVVSFCCIPLLLLPWIRLSRWLYSWTSHILGVLFGVLRGDGGRLKERERRRFERDRECAYVCVAVFVQDKWTYFATTYWETRCQATSTELRHNNCSSVTDLSLPGKSAPSITW